MKTYLKYLFVDFVGPLPNEKGNLCIAGHNYKNSLMFSKLKNLEINDSFFISDTNKRKKEYLIYSKKIVPENDNLSTKNSDSPEVTLITCQNNNNKKRLVIKAKMKEL